MMKYTKLLSSTISMGMMLIVLVLVSSGIALAAQYQDGDGVSMDIRPQETELYYTGSGYDPIDTTIRPLTSGRAYNQGYEQAVRTGRYKVFFDDYSARFPVVTRYRDHLIGSKVVAVAYMDPTDGYDYEILRQSADASYIVSGNQITYSDVFNGVDIRYTYENTELKEEIVCDAACRTAVLNNMPSDYGFSDADSYLVWITEVEYKNVDSFVNGQKNDDFQGHQGKIEFKDFLGRARVTFAPQVAYAGDGSELDMRSTMVKRNGNRYILSGIKVTDFMTLQTPVVFDPTILVPGEVGNATFTITPDSKVCDYLFCDSEIVITNLEYDYFVFNSSDLYVQIDGDVDIMMEYFVTENVTKDMYNCTGDGFEDCVYDGSFTGQNVVKQRIPTTEGKEVVIEPRGYKKFYIETEQAAPDTEYKYNVSIWVLGTEYKIDPYFNTSNTNFSSGEFNNTFLNASGFVQLNDTTQVGYYTSDVFDSGGFSTEWRNITWEVGNQYGIDLVNNGALEDVSGGINMTDNQLLFHMNDLTGNIQDDSGFNRDGVANGVPTYQKDAIFDTAVGTDINDFFQAPDFGGDWFNITYSVWINIDSDLNGSDYRWIFGHGNVISVNSMNLIIGGLTSGVNSNSLMLAPGDDSTSGVGEIISVFSGSADTIVADGAWHHITVMKDDSGVYLWFDGIQVGSNTNIIDFVNPTTDFYVGVATTSQTSRYFPGNIDELAVWNRSFTDEEIRDLYRRGKVKLNMSVRTCNATDCSDGAWSPQYETSPQILSSYNDRYAQYRVEMVSFNNNFTPELWNVSLGYEIDDIAPVVTHTAPIDAIFYDTNNVSFNASVTDETSLRNCSLYTNISGSLVRYGDQSVSGVSDTVSWTINGISDGDYIYVISCLDQGLNNGTGTLYDNFTVQYDTTPPSVFLDEPNDGEYIDDSLFVEVTCNATDDIGLTLVTLYITDEDNTSFGPMGSQVLSGTSDQANFTQEFLPGNYTWNCLATDVGGNTAFAGTNRTFELAAEAPRNVLFVLRNRYTMLNTTWMYNDGEIHTTGTVFAPLFDGEMHCSNITGVDACTGGSGAAGKEGFDYLYNDSTFMYLNETRLNDTIESIAKHQGDVHVAKNHPEDFDSIQAAIDSVVDRTNVTVITVFPGTYEENIVVPRNINIFGAGASPNDVIIAPPNGTAITFNTTGDEVAHIDNIRIYLNDTNDNDSYWINSPGGYHELRNVLMDVDAYGHVMHGTNITGGEVRYDNIRSNAQLFGQTDGSVLHKIFNNNGDSIVHIEGSELLIDIYNDSDDDIRFLSSTSSTNESVILSGTELYIHLHNTTWEGKAVAIYSEDVTDNLYARDNFLNMIGQSNGDSTGIAIEYVAGAGTMHSIGNTAILKGFSNNYVANVTTGQTFISYFDHIEASEGSVGGGSFVIASSLESGSLTLSDALTVAGVPTFAAYLSCGRLTTNAFGQVVCSGSDDSKVEGIGYLYNDSVYMYLNETQLNQTILDVSGFSRYSTENDLYLYNDTSDIFFNETLLNATIAALDQFEADTTLNESEVDAFVANNGYLNNSGNQTYANGTLTLIDNATIYVDDYNLEYSQYGLSTGLIDGGLINIYSGNSSYLNITGGSGMYTDFSDPVNPIVEEIFWDNTSVIPDLTGVRSKWVGIERSGPGVGVPIVESSFSALQKRTIIVLGRVWGNGDEEMTGRGQYSITVYGSSKTLEDLLFVFGSINKEGNVFTASSNESMRLDKSTGVSFRYTANYLNQPTSPNLNTDPFLEGIIKYSYHLQNKTFVFSKSQINSTHYDLDGVATPVPAGNFTVQRIYYFPVSNTVHVTWGQHLYDTLSEAENAAVLESVVLNDQILEGAILRGYICLKAGTTNLSNTTNVTLLVATSGATGTAASGGGGGTEVDPVFSDSPAGSITALDVTNWDTAYGWGDHIGTAHDQFSGLTDDDHPQYIHENGDVMLGDLNMSDNVIRDVIFDDANITFSNISDLPNSLVNIACIDEYIPKWNGTSGMWQCQPDGGLTNITLMEDVNMTNVNDGNYLRWNATSAQFEGSPLVNIESADNIFYGFNSNDAITLSTAWTNINYTDIIRNNSGYDLTSNNAGIEILEDGWYTIEFECSADVSDSTRSHTDWKLIVDGGTIEGTLSYGYHRQTGDGNDMASIHYTNQFTTGQIITAQGRSDRATQVTTEADSCRIQLSKLDTFNVSGLVGPQGPAGPQGLSGANGGGWANDSVHTETTFNATVDATLKVRDDASVNGTFQSLCGHSAVLWAEESGGLSTATGGGLQFSWGNGNTAAYGPPQLCAGTVVGMTMNCEVGGAGGVVEMAIDGVAQGTACSVISVATANQAVVDNTCDISFNSGDQLAPITTTAGGASGCTITFWVVYDNTI